MMRSTNSNLSLFLLFLITACVEPYDPPVVSSNHNYLVVEGTISNGISNFQLTRTSNLNDGRTIYEANATVLVESESGDYSSQLMEIDSGLYEAVLDLNPTDQYRVKIYTAHDKEYVSDFVPLQITPAIDSVTWSVVDNGVQLYVTTHDPQNNTWYYRWTFEETWQYRAPFLSTLDYVDHAIVFRDYVNNQIYNCWHVASSTNILTATSTKLAEDVIYKQPLIYINPTNSNKFDVTYSILVRQYALSKEAFEFWDILKKNSENLGTLFDPQPSQLPGNIHCSTDPDEPVLGFVSAGTIAEQRIFVSRGDIPLVFPYSRDPSCTMDTIPLSPELLEAAFAAGDSIPIVTAYGLFGPIGYKASSRYCVDCRTRGGTNVKPDFWE